MSVDQIMQQVCQYPARHIIITGGEPVMQITPTLTDALHQAGFYIHLETNGTLPLPEGVRIDWITCSPKQDTKIHIQRIDELKQLYWGQKEVNTHKIPAKEYFLQPLDTGNRQQNEQITAKTIDYLLKHPEWKLSLQTHKILNVR